MRTKRPILALSGVAGVVLLATSLVSCGNVPGKNAAGEASQQPASGSSTGGVSPSTGSTPSGPPPVVLSPSVQNAAKGVKVDTVVSVTASAGTVTTVKLSAKGKDKQGKSKTITVGGAISKDGLTWTASSLLEPGSKYRLAMVGKSASDQAVVSSESTFSTQKLSLKQQTFASIAPSKGSTVGIGMPVVLTFDVGIKNRKEFEKHLSVTSSPSQEGSWRWYGNKSVHFRPKTYWKPGTTVKVKADLNSVKAGGGVYGQSSTSTSFTVGRSVITKVNLNSHQAKVYVDGKMVRSIPVSGGKSGWQSRSGTKLIMEKLRWHRMTNQMIGAKESYNFNVPYAMRVTNSGEFLHAAPWKEGNGDFGHRNTSHGCVGMSTANARWLFNKVKVGDPVVTTGTSRGLEQGNGLADWNISYATYKKGSAL